MAVLPGVAAEVEVADFDTELVVLVPSRRLAHHLEPMWALVFDSCRRGDDADDLHQELVKATGWTADETSEWIGHAVAQLTALGVTDPM
jgi:hypothetical protein